MFSSRQQIDPYKDTPSRLGTMARKSRTPSNASEPGTRFQSLSGDSQNLWAAEAILDERGAPGRGDYLVRWEGIDPGTGEAYEPSWEPKTGCSQDLVDEWREKKRQDPSIVGKKAKESKQREKEKRKRKRTSLPKSASKTPQASTPQASSEWVSNPCLSDADVN